MQIEQQHLNNLNGGEIHYEEIPINSLSKQTRTELALLLNPRKILLCENGYSRDWRALVDLAKLQKYQHMLTSEKNPTLELFRVWTEEYPNDTVSRLQEFLGFIDRWDVLDDTRDLFKNDAINFLQSRRDKELQSRISDDNQIVSIPSSSISTEPDETGIFTVDDNRRRRNGEENQIYDAFVLFAEDDAQFAMDLTERMESEGFKLCLKQRDLLPGTFEYEALTTLISERCHRLIVILSPEFFGSTTRQFYVNLAQATGINDGRRKIVPILYKDCVPPTNLKFVFCLKYGQDERLYNFWTKLKESIRTYEMPVRSNVVITDVTTQRQSLLAIENGQAVASPIITNVIPRNVPAITVTSIPEPPKATRSKPRTDNPIMPPRPRLRSSVSMSSLAVKPTKQPNVFFESENLPPIQKLTKKSSLFKIFSSTFSLNSSTTQLVMENGKDSTLKKKKKNSSLSETKVAVAEQEAADDCKDNKKSRKLEKIKQLFSRKS